MTSQLAWWRHRDALPCFLADLAAAEMRRLRPSAPPLSPGLWPPGLPLDERGLGLDSLELLALSSVFSETLHLHCAQAPDTLLRTRTAGAWCDVAEAALDRSADCISFRSSGSTGVPRPHEHALIHLEAEVAYWAQLLPGRQRVLRMVPCHHIYGFLFALLLPSSLGIPVEDWRGYSPASLTALFQSGDLVVGSPPFWQAAARGAPQGWPAGVIGICSGAPFPDNVALQLQAAGLDRLIDIYGASETGGIGWRIAADPSFRLLPGWSRDHDKLSRCDGSLVITAPDYLRWTTPHRFQLDGRRDRSVQVGGINVSLTHVRDVLLRHPDVNDAAVRLMLPNEGERLKAFVIPRDPTQAINSLLASLDAFVTASLSTPERPRAYQFGSALLVGPSGKPADWPIKTDNY
ncbi:MAG: AMP-binding protein [Janthinobacterium lividum]